VDRNDGRTPEEGLAAGATRISKDGGAFAAGPVLGAHDENGNYSYVLASGNTDTLGILKIEIINTTVHLPYDKECRVIPANVYDSLYAGTDNLDVSLIQWLGTAPLALTSQLVQAQVNAYEASVDFNAAQDASIEAQVSDDHIAKNLDHVAGTAAPASFVADTYFDRLADDGTAVYDRTTDSLQAIVDAGGGGLTAAQVWAYDIPSNCAPSDTTACGVLDKLTEEAATLSTDVQLGSVFGQLLDDGSAWTYDRTADSLEIISAASGLTQQQVRDSMKLAPTGGAPAAGSVDEHLDDTLADTNELQTNQDWNPWDDASRTLTAATNITDTGGTIDVQADGMCVADIAEWNTTAVPAEHTAGYPICTIKDGTATGEVNTIQGKVIANYPWSNTSLVATWTVDSGSTTTLVDLEATPNPPYDDFWVGNCLYITGGLNTFLSRPVSSYDAATGTFTFSRPFPETISAGDTYVPLDVPCYFEDQNVVLDTTIETVNGTQNFDLVGDIQYDDQYNFQSAVIYDVSDNNAPCIDLTITDCTAVDDNVRTERACDFTVAAGDIIRISMFSGIRPANRGRQLALTVSDQAAVNLDNVGGTLDAGEIGGNAITAAKIANDAFDQATFPLETIARLQGVPVATNRVADSGSTTTITDAALTETDSLHWVNMCVMPTSGTMSGQVRRITTFDPPTDTITVFPAWTDPITTESYTILASGSCRDPLTQEVVTLSTDVDLASVIGQILDDGGAWSYDRTLHSLEVVGGGGGGGGSPTVPQITAGLWDAIAASYNDPGSMGELQNNLTGGTMTVIQPVLDGGLVEITIGNDYLTVDGLQLQFLFSTPAVLTAATGTMDVYAVNTSTPMLTTAVSIITPTGDPKRVDVDLTRVQTSTFVAPTQYRYVLDFTLASGSEVILVKGRLNAAD
jgi:hypothetical protein